MTEFPRAGRYGVRDGRVFPVEWRRDDVFIETDGKGRTVGEEFPEDELDRLFSRSVKATWKGERVNVSLLPNGKATFGVTQAVAEANGIEGHHYDGWWAIVDPSELTDIEVTERDEPRGTVE